MNAFNYLPPLVQVVELSLNRIVCGSNRTESIVYNDTEVDF